MTANSVINISYRPNKSIKQKFNKDKTFFTFRIERQKSEFFFSRLVVLLLYPSISRLHANLVLNTCDPQFLSYQPN